MLLNFRHTKKNRSKWHIFKLFRFFYSLWCLSNNTKYKSTETKVVVSYNSRAVGMWPKVWISLVGRFSLNSWSFKLKYLSHWILHMQTLVLVAEPDFTKCDMFLDQHLCWPWNNIEINRSDLKNTFIIFVKFRLTISVSCLYISVIHLSFPLI